MRRQRLGGILDEVLAGNRFVVLYGPTRRIAMTEDIRSWPEVIGSGNPEAHGFEPVRPESVTRGNAGLLDPLARTGVRVATEADPNATWAAVCGSGNPEA